MFVVKSWYKVIDIQASLPYAQSLLITDVPIEAINRNDDS